MSQRPKKKPKVAPKSDVAQLTSLSKAVLLLIGEWFTPWELSAFPCVNNAFKETFHSEQMLKVYRTFAQVDELERYIVGLNRDWDEEELAAAKVRHAYFNPGCGYVHSFDLRRYVCTICGAHTYDDSEVHPFCKFRQEHDDACNAIEKGERKEMMKYFDKDYEF